MRVRGDHKQVNQMFNTWLSHINLEQLIVQENNSQYNIDKQVNHLASDRSLPNIELVSLENKLSYLNLVSEKQEHPNDNLDKSLNKDMPVLELKIVIAWEWDKGIQQANRIAE